MSLSENVGESLLLQSFSSFLVTAMLHSVIMVLFSSATAAASSGHFAASRFLQTLGGREKGFDDF